MKLHEKMNLNKDENNCYTEWELEYFDYRLWSFKESIKYLKEAYDINDSYDPIRRAMKYWYALYREKKNEEALFELDMVRTLESPIEALYYYCFEYVINKINGGIHLVPQMEIETENKEYRVDFEICNFTDKELNVIVECDGYDYHSSSKQQARDNQRQRDLENAGYTIIRFSGSEIYNDPVKCVYETLKRLDIEI